MIYTVGTVKIKSPEKATKGKTRTPRQSVPWRDVAESCRTLDAICRQIPTPAVVADAIAKIGFWGAVFRNVWPECEMYLNETDDDARKVLRENFNDHKTHISNAILQSFCPPKCDVGLVDGDKFTLRLLPKWEETLKNWSKVCKYLIVADGACFGFKFGNLKHYNVDTPEEYYTLLGIALHKTTKKYITHISKFENAACILLSPEEPKEVKYIPPSDLIVSRGSQVYKSASSHKQGKLL